MPDLIYLHCLNIFPSFGPKRLALIHSYFNTYKNAWESSAEEMTKAGIDTALAQKWKKHQRSTRPEAEAEKLAGLNISIIGITSPGYPSLLHEISTPPVLLYTRGTVPSSTALMIAAVGSRKITTYGRSVVPHIIKPLAEGGIILVSGLAFGVDALVHEQSITAHMPTIAVLGSGIDDASLYPKAHALLAQRIIDTGGCIMSEYSPGTPGFKQNFVARNRIISGLCAGTIVIECDLKSGSLITARYALEQNRRVYAVPGPIYSPGSRGPNNLIKMGAQLVTDSSDILNDLNISPVPSALSETELRHLTSNESAILGILSTSPVSADELVKASTLEPQVVTTTLTFLEMKNLVRNVGAGQYIRTR